MSIGSDAEAAITVTLSSSGLLAPTMEGMVVSKTALLNPLRKSRNVENLVGSCYYRRLSLGRSPLFCGLRGRKNLSVDAKQVRERAVLSGGTKYPSRQNAMFQGYR